MSELPQEVEGRIGAFRSAWRMEVLNGFITRERVIGSNWYIFWLQLGGRWEYLPFGTLEAGSNDQLPLVGDVEFIAVAIGRTRKLCIL
jgi:hypothetical protein